MEPDPKPPQLTDAEWAEFRALVDAAPTLPCGGRSWEHGFNGDSPIFRPTSNREAKHSVRRLMWAAQHDGKMPSRRVYTLHWGCIDHLTATRAKAAAKPEAGEQLALDVGTGYRRVWAPEHPLATRAGLVLEHRRALYEALDGRHAPCHWCGRDLSWDAVQGDDDELTVDHLDWDRDHNDPANLVPSCRPCNAARRSGRAGQELLDGTGAASRAIASDSGSDQGRPVAPAPDVPDIPERQEDGTDGLSGTGESLWRRVRRNRWVRAAAVAVAVAVASWVAVTSPASFLPGVQIGRRGGQETPQEPPVTSPAPAVLGEAPVASTPPSAERTTTTPWTLPEPCTPAHCPSLDD